MITVFGALIVALLLSTPALSSGPGPTPGMATNASNAILPDAPIAFGLGTDSSPAFADLALGGAIQGTNKLSVTGSAGNLGYFLQYPSTTAQAVYQNLRLDRHSSYMGGSPGYVVQSLWMLTTSAPNGTYYEWPLTSSLYNHTLGTTGAQNVAAGGTTFKQAFSLPVNISNASPAVFSQTDYTRVTTNNTIKFTTTGTLPDPLVVGTVYHVISSGLTVSSFQISASQGGAAINTTTAGSGVHTYTVQGQIGPTWGGNFACNDLTGTVDPLYSCIGAEFNTYLAAGAGTDANRQRVGGQITTGAGGQAGDHVGYGLLFTPTASTTLDRAIHLIGVGGSFGIGLDLSEAGTFGTAGILGSAGTAFSWKNTSAVYDGTTAGARILVGNDDNLYLDNFSNTTTNFRGNNGAARLALTSTTMTSPLDISFGALPNFTVVAGTTKVAATATGNVTFVPEDGQNRYAMNASGNFDVKFNAGGSMRLLGDSTPILAVTGGGGLQIGAPTGGDKGVGTLNPSGALYDNGTAPTGTAGSGYVRATSPTITNAALVTPNLGVATATSITGLSAPVNGSDAANKTFVEGLASGTTWHASVDAATTANLTVTASGTGPGKTLTNSGTLAALVLDGYTVPLNEDVLVKDQTLTQNNGIYKQTTLGTGAIAWVLTRRTDFDAAGVSEVEQGATLIVINGTAYPGNVNSQWVETGPGPFTVDTTPIVFTRLSGGSGSGTVNAGNINEIARFAGTGTAVSGLTTCNNGAIVTSAGGVPSCATTLPSALAIPSPTFSGTVAGASTVPNSVLVNSGLTIGTTTTALGATSPALAGVTSYNKVALTAPATLSTLTILNGKTLTANKTLTLDGTDGTTMTFPPTNKTLAANDYSNLTTLTANAFLTGGGAGVAPNAVALTGIIKGNGASAPTAVTAPAGNLVGTGDVGTVTDAMLAGPITAAKLVGSDITTVGTIATGTWNATAIGFTKGGSGVATIADDQVVVGTGANTTAVTTLPNCTDTGGNHLNYTTATNAFSCGTSGGSGGGASSPPTQQRFTTGTAQTYTTPVGANLIVATVCAAGGGGGGTGATTGTVGATGTTSTFNGINATGGTGGGGTITLAGGAGGAGGTGGTGTATWRVPGKIGQQGKAGQTGDISVPGGGGFSLLGTIASGGIGAFPNSATRGAPGGGGAGECYSLRITSPAVSYTYTVGGGGAGGTATGTGATAGSPGLAGVVQVDEYYPASGTTVATTATAGIAKLHNVPLSLGWIATINPHNAIVSVVNQASTISAIIGAVETATGAAATLSIFKAPSGTACSAGTVLHSGSFNANGTPATNQTLTVTASTVAAGDRLCLQTTGTWTSGIGVVTVFLAPTP